MPDVVQVRIAVAVASNGQWNCYGWSNCSDEFAEAQALDLFDGMEQKLTWLTATLPVPEAQTVQAEVEADKCS
jgi:hypothetical protein